MTRRNRGRGAGAQHRAAWARSAASSRGAAFETLLEQMHAAYEEQGRAFVRHSPPRFKVTGRRGRLCEGYFEGAGGGDYTGWTAGTGLHFDAKAIGESGGRWGFGRLCHNDRSRTPDQALAFDACERCGGRAFVLIAWPAVTVLVPWATVRDAWWRWYREGGAPASISLEEALALGRRCRSRADWLPALEGAEK